MSARFHSYLCGRIAAEWVIFMKTEHIPYILTVASEKSINKASLKCNYPAQKLCNILTNLEQEFDTQFFIRNRQGVCLTPEGEIIIQRLKEIYHILLITKHELHENKPAAENIEGEITLHYNTLLDDAFIIDLLQTFYDHYPKITVKIQTVTIDNIVINIQNTPGTIAIWGGVNTPEDKINRQIKQYPHIHIYPIFRCTPMVVFKKGSHFIDQGKRSISLNRLHDVPLISFGELNNLFSESPSNIQYIRSKDMFFQKLSQGNCYSIIGVSDMMKNTFLKKHEDLDLMPIREIPYFETKVAVNETAPLDSLYKLFLNFIFDFRDHYFNINDEKIGADYFVYDHPIF